jgi:hypothetical protein
MPLKRMLGATAVAALVGCAASGAGVLAAPPRAQLTGATCHRALDPPARSIEIVGVMRPVSGTMKLRMRFVLLGEPAHSVAYSPINGGDLGRWRAPRNPTLGQRPSDIWQLRKIVTNLPAPATYRFRVSFRWIGSHGRVLGTVTETGPRCYQPERRPDLLVRSISVRPVVGKPTEDSYVVVIANNGATAARHFEVEFIDAAVSQYRTIARLGGHASRRVTFTGATCTAAARPTVIVDPTRAVDDYNRANNAMTAVCPPPATAPTG